MSIADLKSKYVVDTKEHISDLGVRSSNVKLIPAQTTVMSFKLSIGRSAITAREMYSNEAIAAFRPKDERLNWKWLYHALPGAAASVVTDTAVKGATLNKAKMAEMTFHLPPAQEQAKIAEILDTCDAVIQKTEALIDNLKAIKQGLLHDLLTRGIDASGRLRPPQSEAPHLYKESPLGWIPKEWDAPHLGSVLTEIEAGWSPSCPEEPPGDGEWGVLKVSAVSSGSFNPRESKRLPPDLRPIPSVEVRAGDVLLVRANGVAELVGVTVLVHETPARLMLSDKTLRLVPDATVLLPGHLANTMLLRSTRKQIGGMLNGSSGQRNIAQGQIRALRVPLPPLSEQCLGQTRIAALERHIAAESQGLERSVLLKSALMDDLLTGRVRVTPLLAKRPTERSA